MPCFSSDIRKQFMIHEIIDASSVSPLFGQWEETLIWSCLQGFMGKIYADDLKHPTAAMAVLGDFTFFAGIPCPELVSYKPGWCTQNYMIMVPQNEGWQTIITQHYGNKAKIITRYATKKEPGIFNQHQLKKAVAELPESFTLSAIDEEIYKLCKTEIWSADLVSQFSTYEAFHNLGIGVVIRKNGLIVSGASSYSRYLDGIEIEIDTREEYRRKGLAYICGAKLILECLKRNLYPSWDAHNPASIALAEKLGYHFSHAYQAVEIWGY